MTLDELEALRLADFEGLYQEEAAARMKISRPTFSRVVEQARRKVATALIQGKALRFDGGAVVMKPDAGSTTDAGGAGQRGRRCAAAAGKTICQPIKKEREKP